MAGGGVGGQWVAFEVVSGGTPKSSVKEYWDGGVPWITLVDLPAEDTITEINDCTDDQRRRTEDIGRLRIWILGELGGGFVKGKLSDGLVSICGAAGSYEPRPVKNVVIKEIATVRFLSL